MASTNLNIRTDTDIKESAEKIFAELGLNMSSAVNIFLRQTIRLKLDVPTKETAAAIEEGRRIAHDDTVGGYKSIEELREALGS